MKRSLPLPCTFVLLSSLQLACSDAGGPRGNTAGAAAFGSAGSSASAGGGGSSATGGNGAGNGGGAGSTGAPAQAGSGGSSSGGTGNTGGAGGSGSAAPLIARVYVGGYDNQISLFTMDQQTGALTPSGTLAVNPSPSFLAFSPSGQTLFSTNEGDNVDGLGAGAVSSFSINQSTGALTFINRVSSQGAGPAHVSVDASGRFVFVANYNGGNIAVLPVAPNGTLAAAVDTEAHGGGAQAHQVVIDATNQYLFVPNKGLSNISQYRFDATSGELTANTPAAVALASGAGTRHLAFHPTAPYAYAINELDDTMTALSYDAAQGTLTTLQTLSTLPMGVNGANNTTAEVVVAPSGNFVYGSNRGHDSIVIYSVNAQSGMLTLVGHQATGGGTPRSFTLDGSGSILLVANQNGNEVVSFGVDTSTGLLTERTQVSVQSPSFVGVLYLPEP
jgi:6-phosphogluconolactonase